MNIVRKNDFQTFSENWKKSLEICKTVTLIFNRKRIGYRDIHMYIFFQIFLSNPTLTLDQCLCLAVKLNIHELVTLFIQRGSLSIISSLLCALDSKNLPMIQTILNQKVHIPPTTLHKAYTLGLYDIFLKNGIKYTPEILGDMIIGKEVEPLEVVKQYPHKVYSWNYTLKLALEVTDVHLVQLITAIIPFTQEDLITVLVDSSLSSPIIADDSVPYKWKQCMTIVLKLLDITNIPTLFKKSHDCPRNTLTITSLFDLVVKHIVVPFKILEDIIPSMTGSRISSISTILDRYSHEELVRLKAIAIQSSCYGVHVLNHV